MWRRCGVSRGPAIEDLLGFLHHVTAPSGSLKCRGKPDRILQMQSYCYSEPPLTELASFDLLVDTPARLIVADEPDSRLPLGHLHNNGSKGEATPHTKLLIDPM